MWKNPDLGPAAASQNRPTVLTRVADPRPDPDGQDEPGARLGRGPATGTPRWVRLAGILLAIALIALFVVLHLTGTLGAGVHQ
jgi:hypothetical protein